MNHPYPFAFGGRKHRRSLELRETVVALFTPTRESAIARLPEFTEAEWRRNLMWLDTSGLALFLIHELEQCNRSDLLPPFLVKRLRQNLADNRERTAWLSDEMLALNREFRNLSIRYANLKGFALGPESVPDAALRCQLDLDFVVTAEDTPRAAGALAKHGYELFAIEKNTWEFKAGAFTMPSIHDLYRPRPQRSVELHLASPLSPRSHLLAQQLARAEMRPVRGRLLPTLSPADIFLNQCTHLYGHFRAEFTRSSWGLELGRHIRARQDDPSFWLQVAELAGDSTENLTAIAVSLIAVENLYRVSAPARFRLWATSALSAPMLLWAHRYGTSALLSDYPGTKFHFLLDTVLPSSQTAGKAPRSPFPRKFPKMVTQVAPNENLAGRLRRYHAQVVFLTRRSRFHILQGLRLLVERRRWRALCGCKGMTFRQPAHDNPLAPRS